TQTPISPDPDQLASQFLHTHRALEQHLATTRVFRVYGTPDEANSFHLETRYPIFLDGRDLDTLKGLFTIDQQDHDQAEALFDIIHSILVNGQQKLFQTPTQALFALNSFTRDNSSMKRFRPLQSPIIFLNYTYIF
ncbi:uncharacterized protein BDW43DRAFT_295668, partial [Aspergillus alliaceus]|uniref:uncharacterized protein n=1 Tax=Petromyces alliaceus TaxID=209559 RepID=UPI0012A417A7